MRSSHRSRRRHPQTIGGVVYLLVLAACAVGLGLVLTFSWRSGLVVVSATLVGAAFARSLIPDVWSGMLKVRAKWIDVLTYAGLGATLFAVVVSVGR